MTEDTDRSLVRNMADPEQVERAKAKKKREADRQASALGLVLQTREGRDVCWELLTHCNVFTSAYDRDPIAMANLAARQDVGHYLMQRIEKTDQEALFTMMRENRKGGQ